MIVFNALQTSLNGGIGRYCYELSKSLYEQQSNIKIVIREEDIEMFSFVKKEDLIIIKGIKGSKDRNFVEQFKLPKIIWNRYPEAVLHYPDTMAPLFSKNEVVITVHDLAFKSVQGAFTLGSTIWKNIITNISVRKAKKIIAITDFTKEELLTYYPQVKSKIHVVHNGFNDFSETDIKMNDVRNELLKIEYDYILTVSTISPRKNIDGLIKAFNEIKNQTKANLIIAGGNGWMYEEVYKTVEKLELSDRVIFTGKVTDEELKYLYKNSSVFAYVSYYEGFGLPPLEAMSYGIPCVVSNVSSIPEVVGDCAIQVDPNNHHQIGSAILNQLDNPLTVNYQQHLKKFSWSKCAEDVNKVYKY